MTKLNKLELKDNKNKVVAFLDVLGFKTILNNRERTQLYFNEVISEIENLKKLKTTQGKILHAVLISDSVVLSYPYEDSIINLRELIVAVAKIQSRLMFHGIWLRGAITIGELEIQNYKDAQVVVGQGLADAYELETRLAIYPRVIIDARVYQRLGISRGDLQKRLVDENSSLKEPLYDPMGDDRREGFALNSLLISDAVWVNYLEFALENESKIRSLCEIIKSDMYSSQTHFTKYKWVQSYLHAMLRRDHTIDRLGPELVYKLSEVIQDI